MQPKYTYLLLLIALLMSSCTWHSNQIFYNMGQEGAYLEEHECKFWKVGNTMYVEAPLHNYETRQSRIISKLGKGVGTHHYPTQALPTKTGYGEITLHESENITYWKRTSRPWLFEKPAGAVPYLNKTGRCVDPDMPLCTDEKQDSRLVIKAEPPQATAHALWAYPLSALSLVAVDIPVTLTVNTVMLAGSIIISPVTLTLSFFPTCPDEVQSAQENTPQQN